MKKAVGNGSLKCQFASDRHKMQSLQTEALILAVYHIAATSLPPRYPSLRFGCLHIFVFICTLLSYCIHSKAEDSCALIKLLQASEQALSNPEWCHLSSEEIHHPSSVGLLYFPLFYSFW